MSVSTERIAAEATTTRATMTPVTEHEATNRPGVVGIGIVLLMLAATGGLATWGGIALNEGNQGLGGALITAACILATVVALYAATGMTIVQPGNTKVLTFFGRYVGTVRRTGLVTIKPWTNHSAVTIRVRNFETSELKVNDLDGNPVNIAAIVVWRVIDTAKAKFAVDSYKDFVEMQAEAALRHVATAYPYDGPDDDSRPTLRGSTALVSTELAREVAERIDLAGVEIIEARISKLAYAPEIAQAMLQRQQAGAIIAARKMIVEGAVGMVKEALDALDDQDIVDLDPERRAAMVSNLLVVLAGDSRATPVVNAGSLYT